MLVNAIKAYGVVSVLLHSFLTLALDGRDGHLCASVSLSPVKVPWYLLYSSLSECIVERKYLLPLVRIKHDSSVVLPTVCSIVTVPTELSQLPQLYWYSWLYANSKILFYLICTINLVQCKLLPLLLMWIPWWLNMRGMRIGSIFSNTRVCTVASS